MSRAMLEKTKNKMRPELELILYSARPKNPENDDRIRALLGGGLDWNEVLACAHQHKLGPVMCELFRTLDVSWLPQDQKKSLDALAHDLAKNNMSFMGQMLSLCRTFEAAGIPAVPFKGPALGWLAYQNFAHRTCVDLDFVVPQNYIPKAMSLLQANGYTPQFDPIEAQAGQRRHAPGQYAFVPSGRRRLVELHTERTLRYFSRPLNLEELYSRAIQLGIGGQKLRSFSVEDLLVMLCVHGAKHLWERLSWIVDIAQLITVQEVNWTLLFQIAAKMESTRLLLLGLYLAHEVVGATLPQSVLERVCGDGQVQWLAGKVIGQYAGKSDPGVGVWSRAVFRLRSCDGFWQGLRQLFRLSLSPTESDRETIRLPGFLSPLYSLVRLFRLLGVYGLGLNRPLNLDLADYEPTPQEIVDQMLRFADVSPGDVLYDLGCGAGRIVVTAAEKYGIRAVGVDINPARIADARANAKLHRVEDRVEFLLADAKNADVSGATIVTLYLETVGVLRLLERLRSQLRPGARIVSRSSQIYGWNPDRTETHKLAGGGRTVLYLWTIRKTEKETSENGTTVPGLRQTHKAEG